MATRITRKLSLVAENLAGAECQLLCDDEKFSVEYSLQMMMTRCNNNNKLRVQKRSNRKNVV